MTIRGILFHQTCLFKSDLMTDKKVEVHIRIITSCVSFSPKPVFSKQIHTFTHTGYADIRNLKLVEQLRTNGFGMSFIMLRDFQRTYEKI